MRLQRPLLSVAVGLAALLPATGHAQLRKLRVITPDSQPVVYAFVTTEGGTGQITDEQGEISYGAGKAKTVTVNVRRIGYTQFFGKINLPDTAATITVVLTHLAQALSEVRVSARSRSGLSVPLQGFYDRWMMRQKGSLSAVFIGPEELEFRNPNNITTMLRGLNGVTLRRFAGQQVAMGYGGTCEMAVLIDGIRQCPARGCKCDVCGTNGPSLSRPSSGTVRVTDSLSLIVPIDLILNANDVAAIEVYGRGGNMPVSLQASDAACGVIALWTGSRKP